MNRLGRILLIVGRILRWAVTAVSVFLLLAVLATWAWCDPASFTVEREALDSREWRAREWVVAWRGERIGVFGWSQAGSVFEARRRNVPMGVQWSAGLFRSNEPQLVDLRAAGFASAIQVYPEMKGWVWDHAGIVVGRLQFTDYGAGATIVRAGFWFSLPNWMAVLIFLLLPVQRTCAWFRHRRERRLEQRGMCSQCGYDLRATPDPDGPRLPRCPECGKETVAK